MSVKFVLRFAFFVLRFVLLNNEKRKTNLIDIFNWVGL